MASLSMATLAKEAKTRAAQKLFDQVRTHLEIAANAYLSADVETLEIATANAHAHALALAKALRENISERGL